MAGRRGTSEPVDLDATRVVALTGDTWDLFADLVQRQGGLFGGCWCSWFLPGEVREQVAEDQDLEAGPALSRAVKERQVRAGLDTAALVLLDDRAVAWAQFGPPELLPNLHHRKQHDAETEQPADWRVTCIQVDKTLRRQGLAEVALRGAVDLVAAAGGGRLEGYPHDMALKEGKKVSSSFLYNGTRRMYERVGFTYLRPKGQFNCTMALDVPAAEPPSGSGA